MKALNLKKVAAVGAGLALVVGSVAAAVSFSDLADSTAKSMKVNGLVVGATADASDSQAAALLASALANKAVYTVKEDKNTCTEQVKEGTGTYDFDTSKAKKVESALGVATSGTEYNYNSVDGLLYWASKKYKVGTSDNVTMQEKIKVTLNPFFNKKSGVDRLTAEVDGQDAQYIVDLGAGIDFNKNGAWTGDWVDNSSSKEVYMPFLGKEYMVYKVNEDKDQIELIEKNSIGTYVVNDKITGLKGKDGKDYYALIKTVLAGTDPEVVFQVYDATTNELTSYNNEKIGEGSKLAEDLLATSVFVTSVDDYSTNKDNYLWNIEVAVGKQALTLVAGEGFPYDSTKTDLDEYDWQIPSNGFTWSGSKLTKITMETTSTNKLNKDKGLKPGESFAFYDDFAMVKFEGLVLPEFNASSPKETETITLGESVTYGVDSVPGLKYIDSGDVDHAVPFYMSLPMVSTTAGDDYNYYKEFDFDGKKWTAYYDVDTNKLAVKEGSKESTGVTASGTVIMKQDTAAVLTDYNATTKLGFANFTQIKDSEGNAVAYKAAFDSDDETLWLMLSTTASISTKYGAISFSGSDKDNDDGTLTVDANFYLPGEEQSFDDLYSGFDSDGETYEASQFVVNPTYASSVTFNYNDNEERLVQSGDISGTSIPFSAQAVVASVATKVGTFEAVNLNRGDSSNVLTEVYDANGAKYTVTEDYTGVVVAPEATVPARFWFFTKAGAGELTGAETETVCTMTQDDVSKAFTGMPLKTLLPTEAVAGMNYIVVGGYMVNSMFPSAADTLATFGAPLAAEGDKVVGLSNGNLYVAGYTKEDTMDAVNALIKELE